MNVLQEGSHHYPSFWPSIFWAMIGLGVFVLTIIGATVVIEAIL